MFLTSAIPLDRSLFYRQSDLLSMDIIFLLRQILWNDDEED
jgi:hypothetical protein